MAVLNVKSVPDTLYRKLQARAKRQRRSVAQEVVHILEEVLTEAPALSVLDLQGLGKEVWAGVKSDEYLRRERQAWDS
jgi:plasmid stability protein